MVRTNNEGTAGGISIHAVDISRGIPAAGLRLRLKRIEPDAADIASGVCSDDGHFQHAVSTGSGVERGIYEIEFDVGDYFRSSNIAIPDPSFLEVTVFRFGIDRVNEHFHLPFKFTPWGYSLFRGGA